MKTCSSLYIKTTFKQSIKLQGDPICLTYHRFNEKGYSVSLAFSKINSTFSDQTPSRATTN